MKRALLLLALVACGDDDTARDSGPPLDAASDAASDAAMDAAIDAAMDTGADSATDAVADASMEASVDAGESDGGFSVCSGDCASTLLTASFGDVVETFDVAYFGLEGDGTVHLEVYGDAAPGCPASDSPTPARTLVIGSFAAPTDTTPTSLSVSLLDFEGTLTEEPILRSSSATATPRAARVEATSMGFVRFDLEASFEGGTLDGAVYATHCDSLDG